MRIVNGIGVVGAGCRSIELCGAVASGISRVVFL